MIDHQPQPVFRTPIDCMVEGSTNFGLKAQYLDSGATLFAGGLTTRLEIRRVLGEAARESTAEHLRRRLSWALKSNPQTALGSGGD
jgi:hypothetical protein